MIITSVSSPNPMIDNSRINNSMHFRVLDNPVKRRSMAQSKNHVIQKKILIYVLIIGNERTCKKKTPINPKL